jgi:Contractile injection system tube protein
MKAKLINEKLPFEMVEFDFNPESLKYNRQSSTTNRAGASPAGVGSTPSILLKAPPKSLVGTGYLVGDDVQDRAEQLYAWMDPGGGLLGQLIGAAVGALTGGRINLAAKPPALIFQWGTQIMRCIMKDVKVTFERFSSSGNPDRALIVFEVIEEFNIFGMLPTNPTSGGMPGRQRHIVSASENVQTISTAAYGNPKLWRGVAEANGIDDPFRVKPGDTVYLPNANEIIGKR